MTIDVKTRHSSPIKNDFSSIPSLKHLLLILIGLFVSLLLCLCLLPLSTLFGQESEMSSWQIRRMINEEMEKSFEKNRCHRPCSCSSNLFSWFSSDQRLKSIIDDVLRTYDADHLALPDYAFESAGASVLVQHSSKTFTNRSPTLNLLGVPILQRRISPNVMLRRGILPGDCWPMIGSQGHVLIQLAFPVRPSMVTLEHLPRSLSFDRQLRSAPKHFSVRGLKTVQDEGEVLGQFLYDASPTSRSHLQTFSIVSSNTTDFYPLIKLIIESNWGHPDFTCIYRFRVHGQAELPQSY